jgi:hypothetical protein
MDVSRKSRMTLSVERGRRWMYKCMYLEDGWRKWMSVESRVYLEHGGRKADVESLSGFVYISDL